MVDSVVSLLAPQPNETIFDLGCGDGILTRKLATDYGVARVVGTDSSPAMIDGAKEEAKKFNVPEEKLELAVWDGQELENSPWAGKGFDAVFSNAGKLTGKCGILTQVRTWNMSSISPFWQQFIG